MTANPFNVKPGDSVRFSAVGKVDFVAENGDVLLFCHGEYLPIVASAITEVIRRSDDVSAQQSENASVRQKNGGEIDETGN